MGYQNNNRPNKKSQLICDISMDMSDLHEDLKNIIPLTSDPVKHHLEQLLNNISFVRLSVKKLINK